MNSKSSSMLTDGKSFVNENCKMEPVCLICSEGLANVDSKSSSV